MNAAPKTADVVELSEMPIGPDGLPFGLTRRQIDEIVKPIRADDIETKQNLSYVPQHVVRAQLSRIFGPTGFDHEAHHVEMLYETRLEKGDPQYPTKGDGKPYYVVCYRVGVTLNIRDYWGHHLASFTEYHVEENSPLPNRGEAQAMALTSCESYALRRAAISIGDAFGLHLYNGGSKAPFVKGTLYTKGDPDSPLYTPPARPSAGSGTPGPVPEGQEAGSGAQSGAQGRGAAVQDRFNQGDAMLPPDSAPDGSMDPARNPDL